MHNTTELDLSDRSLTSLDHINWNDYPNLKVLYCYGNQLTVLPPLPQSLEKLYCGDNQLSGLPPLPQSLKELNFWYNEVAVLPPLVGFANLNVPAAH